MGRKRLGPSRTCVVCGTDFYKPPSHVAKWPAITCSRTCAARHFRDKGKTVNCENCGKDFYRTASSEKLGFGNCCSRDCHFALRRHPRIERECLQCRAKFEALSWSVNLGLAKFCSRACANLFRRKLRKRGERNMFTNWQKQEWKGDKCEKCGSTHNLELDHKKPRFAGGTTERSNAQTLCRTCNRKKFWNEDYSLYLAYLKQRAEVC